MPAIGLRIYPYEYRCPVGRVSHLARGGRAPFSAPRLRWGAPTYERQGDEWVRGYIRRLGKSCGQVLDALEAAGAPYRMEERDRAGLLTEHVHGLPKGWWYVYDGDPHGIRLLVPTPMYEWQDRVLPGPERRPMPSPPKGKPSSPPSASSHAPVPKPAGLEQAWSVSRSEVGLAATEGPVPESHTERRDGEPGEEGTTPAEAPSQTASNVRSCSSCERLISSGTARFCEECGSRL